ncbi:MAG: hypothetical protein J2P48_17090 [Alphaproteobacteria bacterium]|nr:hypothetical protein [Alphaproteobacteria bacterium]
MSRQHHPLGPWHLDEGGLRRRLDRRALVRSALGAGAAAAVLLGSGSAKALTSEPLSPTLVGAIAPRNGVIPWADLAQVEIADGQQPQFSAAISQLNGRPVVIEGHMMVLDDNDPLDRFLLTAYQAHCPFCMPGGFASIIAVHAEKPVRVTDQPLTMRGTLRLLGDNKDSRLLYRLDQAAAT